MATPASRTTISLCAFGVQMTKAVQRVNPMSDHLDALSPGWHAQLRVDGFGRKKNFTVTPAEFYSYRLMVRLDSADTHLHRGQTLPAVPL